MSNLGHSSLQPSRQQDEQFRIQQLLEEAAALRAAIGLLAVSNDLKTSLQLLAKLALPRLGDACAVFTLHSEITARRVIVVQRDTTPDAASWMEGIYPLHRVGDFGPINVLCTGEHESLSDASDEIIRTMGLSPEELRKPGHKPVAYLCMPLSTKGRITGSIAFLCVTSRPAYDSDDVQLARDIASAAAVAIENGTLYRNAQEANRIKDEFVAMVSHELRTPLTPILGCIHLLKTAKLTEANFARALEIIERNAQAQVQLVDDLLDVSRIIAGKLRLAVKPIEAGPIVETAVDSIRNLAESKSVNLELNIAPCDQLLNADPDRLRQMVWNLLSNAVKFTSSGGTVSISVRSSSGSLEIQVADTGLGISPDFLPHIFERFRQAGGEYPNLKAGLGLGLAIVRQLVELHNGTITAASAGLGKGAVFTLTFPLQARKAATASS